MSGKILVTCASRYGSTEEIAERIAATFAAEGTETDVRAAYEVERLEGYRAVVLGSPIYHGKLLGGAIGFARRLKDELAGMPTALFVVCLTMSMPSREGVRKLITRIQPMLELIHPKDLGLFAGKVDYANAGWFMRMVLKLTKIPEGDFRKWDVIERWSKEVLPLLLGESKPDETTGEPC